MLTGNQAGSTDLSFSPQIGIVILAGGKSSRMGRNKALLPISDGVTVLECAVQTARTCLNSLAQDCELVFVSGSYADYQCISDLIEHRGPLGGLHAALTFFLRERARVTHLLFVPVDMPNISAKLLRRLLSNISAKSQVVKFNGHELPMVVTVSADSLQRIEKQLLANSGRNTDYSIRTFISSCSAVDEFQVDELSSFINLNTPSDYENWLISR